MSKPEPRQGARGDSEAALRCLQLAARLLLQYSVRTEALVRHLDRLATHLGMSVQTFVAYRDLTIFVADGRQVHAQVHELRINVTVSSRTLKVIHELCAGRIGLDDATRELEALDRAAPAHGRWPLATIFGLSASALAWLLHADGPAVAASGLSSALGLIARQELGRRQIVLFALPFTAALIGAVSGGLVIALGWTRTPGLALIVPALMLVPGPHLINGVEDVLENHVQTGVSRLALAAGILVAAACGVLLGRWLTLGTTTVATTSFEGMPLTLPLDVLLAGVAACGFGAFYNASWRVLWISILCGMAGHGVRYVSMHHGVSQEMATLLACVVIGVMARSAADRRRLPFSAVAFAGAVPMMPGTFIYEGMAGAVQMSLAGRAADPALAVVTLALFFKAAFVVGAMAVGLLAGDRLARRVGGPVSVR